MLGYKRLQFNVILHNVSKFAPMKELRVTMFPVFWVDEVRLTDVYQTVLGQLIWI